MLDISKTTSLTLITIVLIISGAFVLKPDNYSKKHNYNRCITVTMSESRQSGAFIDAEKAHDFCKGLQK